MRARWLGATVAAWLLLVALGSVRPHVQANQSAPGDAGEPPESANRSANQLELIEDETSWDKGVRLVVIGLFSVVFFIGVCGNALIMTVISRSKRDTTVTDIFIGNLAAADIGLLLGLVFLTTTMYQRRWIFGSLTCKLYMAATSFSQFASSILLVAMSIDRYIAVCHPIFAQRFRLKGVAIRISISVWLACAILMSPLLIFAKTNEDSTCTIFWPEYDGINSEKVYFVYSFVLGYAIPLLIIFSMYGLIIHKLWITARDANVSGSSRRAQNRQTANRLVGHLVFYIIFVYAGCWGPYWVTQLTLCFRKGDQPPIPGFYTIVLISNCLSYANSALNPILYAFLSENFRRRCASVFGGFTTTSAAAPACTQCGASLNQAAIATSQAQPKQHSRASISVGSPKATTARI